MEQNTKETLVGFAIVALLMIIILPFWLNPRVPSGVLERMEHEALPSSELALPAVPELALTSIESPTELTTSHDAAAPQAAPQDALHHAPTPRLTLTSLEPPSSEANKGAIRPEHSAPRRLTPPPATQATPAAPPTATPPSVPVALNNPAAPRPQAGQAVDQAQGIWLQRGSFSKRDNALQLSEQLKQKGFQVVISPKERSGSVMHRVLVGPIAAKDKDHYIELLRKSGVESVFTTER